MSNSPNSIIKSPLTKTPIFSNNQPNKTLVHNQKSSQCKMKKRYFLPLIGSVGILVIEEMQNFIYIPLIISFVSFIIFWNFPYLVYISNTRPLYYEDLFIDSSLFPNSNQQDVSTINPIVRQRFENRFQTTLIITNTLFMGALADYWLYKFKYDPEVDQEYDNDYYEIIGVTGGIIKIFQFLNNTLGSMMLHFIHEQLKKEHQETHRLLESKKSKTKELELEMISIENIKHVITDSPPKNVILDNSNDNIKSNIKSIEIVRDYEANSDEEEIPDIF